MVSTTIEEKDNPKQVYAFIIFITCGSFKITDPNTIPSPKILDKVILKQEGLKKSFFSKYVLIHSSENTNPT
jgi:hypothetical protein